jgi:hypothetical protein
MIPAPSAVSCACNSVPNGACAQLPKTFSFANGTDVTFSIVSRPHVLNRRADAGHVPSGESARELYGTYTLDMQK